MEKLSTHQEESSPEVLKSATGNGDTGSKTTFPPKTEERSTDSESHLAIGANQQSMQTDVKIEEFSGTNTSTAHPITRPAGILDRLMSRNPFSKGQWH